jgi:hypothetical protein
MRSGANATWMSSPMVKPRSVSGSASRSCVVPTYVVDVRMSVCRARACSTAEAGGAHGGEVRVEIGVDRRRDGDDHGVGVRQRGGVRRQHEPAGVERLGQARAIALEEVDVAGADRVEPALGDIEADDREAGLAKRERRRQADVSEADDGHGQDVVRG